VKPKSDHKTIALIDWNWVGHHPTYFTHFAAAMAEAGAEVVPFCADPTDFAQRLVGLDLGGEAAARIATAEKVEGPRPSNFRPARWRGIYEARKFFGGLGKQLRAWETKHGRKIDLAFFACIYDRQFECLASAERWFGYEWSGLYLHSRSFRLPGSPIPGWWGLPCPEKIFTGRLLRSVAVLDEGAVEPLRNLTAGKPVLVFPDITDANTDSAAPSLGAKFKALAAGRPVVSLSGYLQKTKGIAEFVAAARAPGLQGVLFVLAGSISLHGFSVAEREDLQRAIATAPNILTHLMDLPEPAMNSVIQMSDVIFAAYRDFPNSSNALTKAAVFERPILVSDGHLMGERVRNFGLGEVVTEGDVGEIVAALERMSAPGYLEALQRRAKWAEYREAHSMARLTQVMRSLLEGSLS
jgi:hypothetical protein